ncbi:hypothetical protein [Sphingomonas sp.]|uniref:hypothetical protein n=1 Tax=Sphingomonas sp. TaxID=28214 RepID=UPI0025DDCD82|nr:hypothetical protein [Sphingomonas sp.]
MRFLRLLFWLFVALLAALFLGRNWSDVTVDLWGNVQADIKLPLLLLIAFLVGLLPTAIGWRIRWWRMKRSQQLARPPLQSSPPPPPFADDPRS